MAYLEGGFSLTDAAATVYVIKARARRAGWSFERMAWKYSALDADNDRARFARELPNGDLEEWGRAENRRWAAVRRVAALALAGRVRNPAPGATHWGARNLRPDVERGNRAVQEGRWERVQSETKNAFFRLARGGEVVAAAEAAGVMEP